MTNKQLFDLIDRCEDRFVKEAAGEGKKAARRHGRRMFGPGTWAAAAVVCVLFLGTGAAAASNVSGGFRELLMGIFGEIQVTEAALETEEEGSERGTEHDDVDGGGLFRMGDDIVITGVKESFVHKIHSEEGKEITDHIYTFADNGLKELSPSVFRGTCYGRPFSFGYVIVGDEICAFNQSGTIGEVFHRVVGDHVYASFLLEKHGIFVKGCIATINLRTGELHKLTGDGMICNFLMSPNGEMILCNHRSDGYWSVFDIAKREENRVDAIFGYAHRKEIEFVDDYHILTFGDAVPVTDEDGEDTGTMGSWLIDLRTREVIGKYSGFGDVTIAWEQLRDGTDDLKLRNIMTQAAITIPGEGQSLQELQCVGQNGGYALFASVDGEDSPIYLVNLNKQSWLRLDIPKELFSSLEIYLAGNVHKLLITNGREGYLVDVDGM